MTLNQVKCFIHHNEWQIFLHCDFFSYSVSIDKGIVLLAHFFCETMFTHLS